jgi:hypothetical protein
MPERTVKPGYLRTGRSVGRTLYECTRADRDGTLVGVVDTPELAAEIVAAVNRQRARVRVATHTGASGEVVDGG